MRLKVVGLAAALLALPAMAQQNDEAQAPDGLTPQVPNPIAGSPAGTMDDLFTGTGAFGGGVANSAFTIDSTTDTATTAFSGVPVWGAAYDAANDRVLFTSSGGTVDGADLFEWSPTAGGAPTAVGTITLGGTGLRIDGLAFSGGVLYGVHQFDDATSPAGLFSIDQMTFAATFEVGITSGAVSGIGADAATGIIYGADDTATEIVIIDPVTGSSTFADYPAGETDVDGVAVGNGNIYLVRDEAGDIHVYNIMSAGYDTPLTSPHATADTFSAGAFLAAELPPPPPATEIPTLSTAGIVLLVLLLAAASAFMLRRRVRA